jgi:hypothetical protein
MSKNKTEDMKEYNKKYYEKNKDKLHEKIMCECGEEYSKYKKSTHKKTQKHRNKMMEIEIKKLKTSDNTEVSKEKKNMIESIEKKASEILKSLESLEKIKKKLECCSK